MWNDSNSCSLGISACLGRFHPWMQSVAQHYLKCCPAQPCVCLVTIDDMAGKYSGWPSNRKPLSSHKFISLSVPGAWRSLNQNLEMSELLCWCNLFISVPWTAANQQQQEQRSQHPKGDRSNSHNGTCDSLSSYSAVDVCFWALRSSVQLYSV